MNAANRVVKNTGILYARMAITVFISLYSTRLILSALGVEDFGIFNLVAGTISMLSFLNGAMSSSTQRFMSYAEGAGDFNKLRTIFNVSIVLHLIIAVAIFFLLQIVGYYLFDGLLKIPEERLSIAKLIFQFSIISTLFTVISVPYDAVINAHENMLLFAVLGAIEAILKLGIAVYITYANYDSLIMYGVLTAALSILLLIVKRIYCHRKYKECKIDFKNCLSAPVFKEMTGFAGWNFLATSTSMISSYGQGIVMNMFFGAVVNAAQGIASQVSGQLSAFASTMLKALNPLLAKSEGAGNRKLVLKASVFGSKISFFLLMLFFIPVLIDMPYIFELWLKNVPEYVIVFCRLLLIRNLIEQLFVTLNSSISAEGNIKTFKILSSCLSFFPLIVSFLLFRIGYPPYALYVVFIIYSLCYSALTLYYANKNLGLPIVDFMKNVVFRCIFTFLATLVFGLIPVFLDLSNIVSLGLTVVISLMASTCFIWLIGLTSVERMDVRILLYSIKNRLPLIKKTVFYKN